LEADQKVLTNKLLRALAPDDFAYIARHLDPVELPVRKLLEARNRPIEAAYFLESGMASVVVNGGSHHTVEVGMIGLEGMTGLAILMGADRSPSETFIQSAGTAWRITAEALVRVTEDRPVLRRQLLRHAHIFQVQMSFTALSNARYKLEERLARWLLMAHDRVGGPTVSLTHEFLSLMLGVRRPGVTAALNEFERKGMISAQRAVITILDRTGLEGTANGCYGAPEAEYQRLVAQA
jgi:CRP-like cAMP-binding protein